MPFQQTTTVRLTSACFSISMLLFLLAGSPATLRAQEQRKKQKPAQEEKPRTDEAKKKLEKEMEVVGAPWTPGRVPEWKEN